MGVDVDDVASAVWAAPCLEHLAEGALALLRHQAVLCGRGEVGFTI